MKSFLSFLFEAKQSKAVQQATKMGLRSDGHGGWYDERGEFVAKTVGDGLEFFNSNQQDGRDPAQSEADKKTSGEEAAGGAALGTRVKDTEGATQAQANNGAVAPEATAQDAAAAQQAAPEQQPLPHPQNSRHLPMFPRQRAHSPLLLDASTHLPWGTRSLWIRLLLALMIMTI